MICQPPGLSNGYTPVCGPAMPTEPAGDPRARRLAPRHGDALVNARHVGKPGQEPEHEHPVLPGRMSGDDLVRRPCRPTPPRRRDPARSGRRSRRGSRSDPCAPGRSRGGAAAAARATTSRSTGTSVRNGSKCTANDPYAGTTSRTPGTRACRTRSAAASTRMFTITSIVCSNSTSSAASPKRVIRMGSSRHGTQADRSGSARDVLQRPDQLPMNAAEAAVRHDEHHVPVAMLADDRLDDGVDGVDVPRRRPARAEIGDQLID